MRFRFVSIASATPLLIAAMLSAALIFVILGRPYVLAAPQARHSQATAKNSDQAALIARGKYIVEGIAGCGYCHTPRDENGDPDRTKWLAGAPVFYQPARPVPGWPTTAPRLAGLPPGSDTEIIALLTTSVSRSGKPPRPPMPRFHMTGADAKAVVVYLKSLNAGQY